MPRPGQLGAPTAAETLSDRIAIGLLTHAFPPELVDRLIAECGRTEQRRRLLPARTVVYFVLAICLFARHSYGQVAQVLTDGLGWALPRHRPGPVPTTATISRARVRLGAEPLAAIFAEVTGRARPDGAARADGRRYQRWRVVAIDGTAIDVPDTSDNRDRYGPPPHPGAECPAFPQVHLMALAECGSHTLTRAVVEPAPDGTARPLADELLGALTFGDLLLSDCGATGLELLPTARASGAELLWAVRPGPDLPVRAALPDGSYLCDIARAHTVVRVIEELPHRLVTTLLDHETAPLRSLRALYGQRWRIRTSLDTFGAFRRDTPQVLRSRWPAGVEQEVWGHLLVHHTLRSLLHPA